MDTFWINVSINLIIGFAVIIGFIVFLKKRSDLLDEGGTIRELWKLMNQKTSKPKKNVNDNTSNENDPIDNK